LPLRRRHASSCPCTYYLCFAHSLIWKLAARTEVQKIDANYCVITCTFAGALLTEEKINCFVHTVLRCWWYWCQTDEQC
jgi:hypothetical protein